MAVHVWAWAVFVAVCAGILLSFRAFDRDRHRVSLLLIIAAGFLLRWYAGGYQGLHPWDERYHALVARNLCFDPLTPTLYRTPLLDYDFRDWQANHVWLHKPPLALWLMAVSIAALGATEFAVRLPSLLLSTLQIPLTYALGKRLWSEKVGLTAALFHAVSPQLIRLATGQQSVDHVDTALVFFIELAVWLAVVYRDRPRRLLLLAIGLVTGLALLSKWLPGLIVCPVFLLLLRPRLGLAARCAAGGCHRGARRACEPAVDHLLSGPFPAGIRVRAGNPLAAHSRARTRPGWIALLPPWPAPRSLWRAGVAPPGVVRGRDLPPGRCRTLGRTRMVGSAVSAVLPDRVETRELPGHRGPGDLPGDVLPVVDVARRVSPDCDIPSCTAYSWCC